MLFPESGTPQDIFIIKLVFGLILCYGNVELRKVFDSVAWNIRRRILYRYISTGRVSWILIWNVHIIHLGWHWLSIEKMAASLNHWYSLFSQIKSSLSL